MIPVSGSLNEAGHDGATTSSTSSGTAVHKFFKGLLGPGRRCPPVRRRRAGGLSSTSLLMACTRALEIANTMDAWQLAMRGVRPPSGSMRQEPGDRRAASPASQWLESNRMLAGLSDIARTLTTRHVHIMMPPDGPSESSRCRPRPPKPLSALDRSRQPPRVLLDKHTFGHGGSPLRIEQAAGRSLIPRDGGPPVFQLRQRAAVHLLREVVRYYARGRSDNVRLSLIFPPQGSRVMARLQRRLNDLGDSSLELCGSMPKISWQPTKDNLARRPRPFDCGDRRRCP